MNSIYLCGQILSFFLKKKMGMEGEVVMLYFPLVGLPGI